MIYNNFTIYNNSDISLDSHVKINSKLRLKNTVFFYSVKQFYSVNQFKNEKRQSFLPCNTSKMYSLMHIGLSRYLTITNRFPWSSNIVQRTHSNLWNDGKLSS